MRRTLAIAAFSLLALTACRSKSVVALCSEERTPIERFSLCLTDGWHHRSEQYGEAGSFIVLVMPPGSTGSLLQIHVKKDPLQEAVYSDLDFAQRAVEITRSQAPNYAPVRTEPLMIGSKKTLLHVFDASPSPNDEFVRYYQLVTTHGGIAYGFTAIMHPDAAPDSQERLLEILKSVSFD